MIVDSIILARGGSKGIKNKNLIKVGNKPLLYWSVKKSLNSKKIRNTWVSSDSKRIINYARNIGSKVIVRPKKYSMDNSSSESAWLHAIKYIEKKNKCDAILAIQPSSPIRIDNFDRAINFFEKSKFDSLFSSSIIKDYCVWKKNKNKFIAKYNFKNRKRRQQIKNYFLENGSFYIFKIEKFKKTKNRLFGKIGTFIQSKKESFQLDDIEDLFIIKSLINNIKIYE
jgi:CMP-N,N'-diacetyllegionaminic acid synthase